MKKIAYLASTALVLTSLAATPAFASLPAPSSAGVLAMEAACLAAKPADGEVNVGSLNKPKIDRFTYGSSVTGVAASALEARVVVSPKVLVTPAATTPVLSSPFFKTGSEVRRGGSPNIHGELIQTATYAGAVWSQLTTTYPRTQFAFNCTFTKTITNHKGQVNTISPWKTDAASTPLVEEGAGVPSTATINDPPVVDSRHHSDVSICNSPGPKGGQWRNQNGYTGTCSTALYNSLETRPVTSNATPIFTSAASEPEGERGGRGQGNPHVNAVFDNDPDTVPGSQADPDEATPAGEPTSGE